MKTYCAIIFAIGLAIIAVADQTNAPVNPIFGQYDHALKDRILWHWTELLNAMPVKTPPPTGKVVMQFRLFPDGHVSDLKIDNSTIEETQVALCKRPF